jgi:hypothetical protein
MSLKLVTAALLAVVAATVPAFACMGPTVIYADNFQAENPAWTAIPGSLAIESGQAKLTAPPGVVSTAVFEGSFMDSADACVDIAGPTVPDPGTVEGGILFGFNDEADYYAFVAFEDGRAAIFRLQNDQWLTPVAPRPAPALRTGPNSTNTIRISWKGSTASAYINTQPFVSFNIPQTFQNTKFGLFTGNDADNATTFQFSNLKVTNVP